MAEPRIIKPEKCETCPFFRRYKDYGPSCGLFPQKPFPYNYRPKPDFCDVERIEVYKKRGKS